MRRCANEVNYSRVAHNTIAEVERVFAVNLAEGFNLKLDPPWLSKSAFEKFRKITSWLTRAALFKAITDVAGKRAELVAATGGRRRRATSGGVQQPRNRYTSSTAAMWAAVRTWGTRSWRENTGTQVYEPAWATDLKFRLHLVILHR